jgi:hypothetical protein
MRFSRQDTRWLALVALSLLIAAGCGFTTSGTVEVYAEGVAAYERGGDEGAARDEALRDAWRQAVAIGVGCAVRAEVYVENKRVITQEIHTNVMGYIEYYEILKSVAVENLWRVSIRADVDMLSVEQMLGDFGIQIESIGNPRVVVVVRESNLGEEQPFSIAEAGLRLAFYERGFTVLQYEGMANDPRIQQAIDGDIEAAVNIARAFDADITVVGGVFTISAGEVERGLFTWQQVKAYGDFSTVLRDTGVVLSSVLAQTENSHPSATAAGTQGIESVTAEALPTLLADTIAALNYARGNGVRALKLLASGIETYDQATAVKRALESLREVSYVDHRTFDQGFASYDVEYLGPADALAQDLESGSFADVLEDVLGRSCQLTIRSFDFAIIEAELSER